MDSDGLVTLFGKEVLNSNIIDLIHEVVRPRMKTRNLAGIDQFVHLLQQINIPQEYLGRSLFSSPEKGTPKRGSKRRGKQKNIYSWDDDEF